MDPLLCYLITFIQLTHLFIAVGSLTILVVLHMLELLAAVCHRGYQSHEIDASTGKVEVFFNEDLSCS